MANNKKTAGKTAPKQAKKPAKTVEAQIPATPVVEAEVVEETPANISQMTAKNMAGTTHSKLDANHREELLKLADDIFRKDPAAETKFPVELREGVNSIVAAGVVSALADEAMYGDSTFSTVLKSTMYPQLVVAAKEMGITLPNIKALPAGDEEGTVKLPSESVKVSKEAKAQLAKEHAIEQKAEKGTLELDPIKVAHLGEEDLQKALEYLLITGPKKSSVKDSLVAVVDFMHDYRIELARQAENSTEAMNKLEDRTMYEWLSDIFSYVTPTFLIKGIGRGMRQLIVKEKSPLSAFLVLRQSMTDNDTNKVAWDDQSIADAVRAIVEFICKNEIAADEAHIAELDTKNSDYETVKNGYDAAIAVNKEVLSNLDTIDFTICDEDATSKLDEQLVNIAYGRLLKTFYPDIKDRSGQHKNLEGNLRQYAGIVLNLFCSPANQNLLYSASNIVEIEEIPLEEWMKQVADEKKQAAAEKKEESKNALPSLRERDSLTI